MTSEDYLEMRKDIETTFDRSVTLHKKVTTESNSIYGNKSDATTDYTIDCQMRIMAATDSYVKQGLLKTGDAVATFRYEYSEETDGTSISSAITVEEFDEITSNNKKFRVEEIHEITDTQGNLGCHEATKLIKIN